MPSHVPRWTRQENIVAKCCLIGCEEDSSVATHIPSADIAKALQVKGFTVQNGIPSPAPLCQAHYHMVYNTITPTQVICTTCGTLLKRSASARVCPDPEVVLQHLKLMTGFEGPLTEKDSICHQCYKHHLFIVKQKRATVTSTDSDLHQIIATLNSNDDVLHSAMGRVTIEVAEMLLARKVTLLSSIYDSFCQHAHNFGTDVTTPRNILGHLAHQLQHHLQYRCVTRKYGTVLFRFSEDALPALSHALWKVCQLEHKNTSCNTSKQPNQSADSTQSVSQVLESINTKVLAQAKTFVEKDTLMQLEHTKLNFDKIISEIDPDLWESIVLLTQSASEKKKGSETHHNKKLRRLYLLCTMLFIADNRCCFPLHTLLADIVDSQGGTALLIKILNRFGVCSSIETLNRFIQYRVNQQSELEGLNPDGFMIISADNIDFLHSYARVFSGNQVSSTHVTSIQTVQPLPSLSQGDNTGSYSEPTSPMSLSHSSPSHAQVCPPSLSQLPGNPTSLTQDGPPSLARPLGPLQDGPPSLARPLGPLQDGPSSPLGPLQDGPPSLARPLGPLQDGPSSPLGPLQDGPPSLARPLGPLQDGPPSLAHPHSSSNPSTHNSNCVHCHWV